jgi:hypothetical protein
MWACVVLVIVFLPVFARTVEFFLGRTGPSGVRVTACTEIGTTSGA